MHITHRKQSGNIGWPANAHPTLGSARKREIQLKKWSRAKKEALIAGNLYSFKKSQPVQIDACNEKRD
jgi:predicted GIY-YIG superfamily endonuclease